MDTNGDNAWSGTPADTISSFGMAGDKPTVMDRCNPSAQTSQIFVLRGSSQWFSTANDLTWNAGDQTFTFGFSSGTAFPVTLDGHLAVFEDGIWLWDSNDDHQFLPGDSSFSFGQAGDRPVTGRWGSTPTESLGVFRNGTWLLDQNNDRSFGSGDVSFGFGQAGDLPVVSDFNPNHAGDEVAVFRNGSWFIDFNGTRNWDAGDKTFTFGQAGDIPVVATASWRGNMCIR